jgi:hypothetical protein
MKDSLGKDNGKDVLGVNVHENHSLVISVVDYPFSEALPASPR